MRGGRRGERQQGPQPRAQLKIRLAPAPLGRLCRRVRGRGVVYRARWWADGRQHSKTFTTRGEAEKHLAKRVDQVHDGVFVPVTPRVMAEVFAEWNTLSLTVRAKQQSVKPSTVASYRSMLRTHLQPTFGTVRSDQLSGPLVEAWVAELADRFVDGTLSKKTVRNLLSLLDGILQWARRPTRRYLAHDPLTDIEKPRCDRVEREFLEPEEVAALLRAARPPVDTIVHLAVFAGLRRGELCALQWKDITWGPGGALWIRRAISGSVLSTPKTPGSVRKVDVSQQTLAQLASHKLHYPPGKGDFVLPSETGSFIDPDNLYKRMFLPPFEAAGVRQVGLHALRHTFASILINNGESIKYVSRQMGHASIALTADLYGHLFAETSQAAMARLEARQTAIAELIVDGTAEGPAKVDRVM
jgi:integrase